MKEKRTGTMFIVFGVVLAAIVGGLAYFTASRAEKPNVPSEIVVVAAQDIPERTIIASNALATKRMPIDVMPPGAVKKLEEVIGRMSVVKIAAGEVVLTNKLADTKGQSGVSFTIDQGKVVVTFPASNIIGLGLVRPGDTIDLLVTYKPDTKTSGNAPATAAPVVPNVTQTTMQNLKILTIGPASQPAGQQQQQQHPNSAGAAFITFAVEPQDALFLKAIKDADNIVAEMALRSAQDNGIHKTEPVSIQDILTRYEITLPNSQSSVRR